MKSRLRSGLVRAVCALAVMLWLVPSMAQVARPKALTRGEAFSLFALLCARSGIWPAGLDPVTHKRLSVGLLGRDPELLTALRNAGRKAEAEWFKGGEVTCLESERPEDLDRCQVILLGELPAEARARTIEHFRGRPVVLISAAPGFVRAGGIAEVRIVDEKFQFDLNLDALRAAGVELTAKFRGQAHAVVFDGRHQPNTNRAIRATSGGDRP